MNEWMRTWREANRDKLAANQRRYYAAHRDEIAIRDKERKAKFYAENKERVDNRNREWAKQHPDRVRSLLNDYRVRKNGAAGSHTVAQWLALVDEHHGCCAYCGRKGDVTRDHVVPLSKGGSDDIENLLPACRSCNSRKHVSVGTWKEVMPDHG